MLLLKLSANMQIISEKCKSHKMEMAVTILCTLCFLTLHLIKKKKKKVALMKAATHGITTKVISLAHFYIETFFFKGTPAEREQKCCRFCLELYRTVQ